MRALAEPGLPDVVSRIDAPTLSVLCDKSIRRAAVCLRGSVRRDFQVVVRPLPEIHEQRRGRPNWYEGVVVTGWAREVEPVASLTMWAGRGVFGSGEKTAMVYLGKKQRARDV